MFSLAAWPLGTLVADGMFCIWVTISVPLSGMSVVYDHIWWVCVVKRRRSRLAFILADIEILRGVFKQLMKLLLQF